MHVRELERTPIRSVPFASLDGAAPRSGTVRTSKASSNAKCKSREVVAYTDPKGASFTATYDPLSRPTSRFEPGDGTTNWTWGASASDHNIGQLYSVSSTGGTVETYSYDGIGRLSNRRIVSDSTYDYDFSYNPTTGFLDTLTYPLSTSGYRLKLQYFYQYGGGGICDWLWRRPRPGDLTALLSSSESGTVLDRVPKPSGCP